MNSRTLLYAAFLSLGATTMFAQTGAQDGSKYGKGADSIRCITNTSLYEPYAKSKNYKDALPYWELAYAECPASSKNLYINGVKIVEWQISQEKDPAKRQALVEKLMNVYDNRIKYFGDDRAYPASRLLGLKAVDYLTYMGNSADLALAYGWLKESVAAQGANSSAPVIKDYVSVASKMFRQNNELREEYLTNYQTGVEYLDEALAKTTSEPMKKYIDQVKTFLAQELALSGAADCDALQAMFAPKIEENKDNIAFLKSTISLLRRSRCQESEAYFTASGYAHKIEPTMESAIGIAKQAVKKDDYDQAITYFKDASTYAVEAADKAEIALSLASLYYKKHNYPQARAFARESLEADPNQATPYILIANMYATSGKSIYPNDQIMAQAVYFAAVDKLLQARAAEPSRSEEINSMISSFRQRYPSKEDIFMHPSMNAGDRITIGGWIGETTTVPNR